MKKRKVEVASINPQPINTEEIIRSLEKVSLKDEDITKLQKEKRSLEKENKEYQEKNAKLKDRLIGRHALQSAHHYLWDLIAVEVAKIWEDMKILEANKDYIYLALDKCTLAREKM